MGVGGHLLGYLMFSRCCLHRVTATGDCWARTRLSLTTKASARRNPYVPQMYLSACGPMRINQAGDCTASRLACGRRFSPGGNHTDANVRFTYTTRKMHEAHIHRGVCVAQRVGRPSPDATKRSMIRRRSQQVYTPKCLLRVCVL